MTDVNFELFQNDDEMGLKEYFVRTPFASVNSIAAVSNRAIGCPCSVCKHRIVDNFSISFPHKNVLVDCAKFDAELDEDIRLRNATVTLSTRYGDNAKANNPIFVIANYLFDRYCTLIMQYFDIIILSLLLFISSISVW